ncbi:MAG TPA: hypothetical protein VMW68_06405 [Methyloceanibacter sp.]|nr:hypothetical protein [Methyloceanibacter sp.]
MWWIRNKKRPRKLAVSGATEEELAKTLAFLEEIWEEGAKEAVATAVSLCATYRHPPPPWLALAVTCLVSPRYQHDMVHIRRWHLVRILRARGIDWRDVYDVASKHLAQEGAPCVPDAVRKSYDSVQAQLGARG